MVCPRMTQSGHLVPPTVLPFGVHTGLTALFADHTIKTPNLISERPPRGDLFTLIESTTEPQLCCGALVAIGTKRTFQPPLRLSAIGATADITSAIRRQCYFSSNTNVL